MNEQEHILNRDFRIERLQDSKDETEQEIKNLNLAIEDLKELKDTISGTAREHTELFLTKLKQDIDDNNQILQEIEQSIEFVRTN